MRALSAPELLDVWERGWSQPPAGRALALLAAAFPETSAEALAQLSIGQRDGRLLALRERTFGPELIGLATCPACGEPLELNFTVADIRVSAESERLFENSLKPPSSAAPACAGDGAGSNFQMASEAREVLSLDVSGFAVRFRLPNSLDLVAIAGSQDVSDARQRLLARCLMAADREGEASDVQQLPAHVVDAVIDRMTQADPQADVRLALACPVCGHRWEAAFDIASFFWSEINAWAQRMLHEVHTLAAAYGWREADVLALSPRRRQLYLELARTG